MKIIRAKELAKKLTISVPTLWRMEQSGELPPKIQISKRISGWRESDIQEWMKQREIIHSNLEEV
jgi:prophage regulatory protein